MTELRRCGWAEVNDLMREYHDREWGVPVHDDRKLFEYMVLDGFQAGLSWATILNKRDNFRRAFDDFDPTRIARYTKRKIEKLMADAGIVRNRQKIESGIGNAKAFLELQREYGSFDAFIWQFVGGAPSQSRWRTMKQIPATSPVSDRMSKDLKSRGFRFVGSTICYAFVQAAGLVNDHVVTCFRHDPIRQMSA